MTAINTVLGAVDSSQLGFTLMHEHLLAASAGIPRDFPELLGSNFMDRIVAELIRAKQGGVDTIVDATTPDLGRDVEVMAEASRRSGVNIIACTGWWLDIPRFFQGLSANQFAQIFVREIKEGISGTNIKAGIIKAASDAGGVTSMEERVLRGVARAHLETGVPVTLHSYSPGRVGEQQLRVLEEEGVNLARVKMDHSNDTTDVAYLTKLLEKGCYLGLDRYPGGGVTPIERTRTMRALMEAGYADRLLPSHDWVIVHIAGEGWEQAQAAREQYNPHGYLYFKNVVLPWLKEMGVSPATLDRLCVYGPQKFFEGAAS
ncbi:MAG: hypothetical protein HY664_04915 [Chloroflexi bacterium]|nr:hypothetical protein [Chloroflexota bacterium]